MLLVKGGRRFGVEIKHGDGPRLTPSMRTAMEDLSLESLTVIYPGDRSYALTEGIEVLPLAGLVESGARALTTRRRRRRTS